MAPRNNTAVFWRVPNPPSTRWALKTSPWRHFEQSVYMANRTRCRQPLDPIRLMMACHAIHCPHNVFLIPRVQGGGGGGRRSRPPVCCTSPTNLRLPPPPPPPHCCLWKWPHQLRTHLIDAVIHMQGNPPQKRSLVECSSPFLGLAQHLTSWRFALGASNVCLVGESPT